MESKQEPTSASSTGADAAVATRDDYSDAGLFQLSAAAEAAAQMNVATTPVGVSSRDAETATSDNSNELPRDARETPARVVQLITHATNHPTKKTQLDATNSVASRTTQNQSIASSVAASTGSDVGLPPGWRCVLHESGLPCFVNEDLQVVTWTRPYTLDAIGADFVTLAKTHVPPLSIFSRRDVGPRQAQLLACHQPSEDSARRNSAVPNDDVRGSSTAGKRSRPDEQTTPPPPPAQHDFFKKRKADLPMAPSEPTVCVRQSGASIALVEVNGKALESPEGKSVHAFLREFAMAMWKVVPQYTFSKADGGELPMACSVRIQDKQYATCVGPNKPAAKEAAAEAVLEKHIPGYWIELKKQGRVGKYPLVAQVQQCAPPSTQVKEERKKSMDEKEKEPLMTADEFKTLTLGDPRVLQACMDLSIKTPAQVVQEYQNRHRGVSVNYNTVPHESDGQKLFKTIVTAGSTVAEGVAATKKVAKQYAAQSLLQLLHQRTVKYYFEVADLYSRGNHSDLLAQVPLTVQTDVTSARTSPLKKPRRSSPQHNLVASSSYGHSGAAYNRNNGGRGWQGGYPGYGGTQNSSWQAQRSDTNYDTVKSERIVEYYSPNSSGYSGGYYGNADGWNGYARPQHPQYSSYGPTPYGPPTTLPPPSAPYASVPHVAGPAPGYPYGDPRASSFHRPKF